MTESVPLQVPLIGLEMSGDTAQYVGMLEGTIAALCINEIKFRTLLELLTGESWDDAKATMDPSSLMALAVSVLVKQTGMDKIRAQVLVSQRWADHNDTSNTVIPVAIPVADLVSGTVTKSPTMSDRFKSWKSRQLADAMAFYPPTPVDELTTENGTQVLE